MKTLIIIPAYDEHQKIGEVLDELQSKLADTKKSYDIVVVNDGSNDTTSEIARAHNVIVINHLVNMGTGAATRTGLEYAKRKNYDFAVTIDADGQHITNDLVNVIQKLQHEKLDLVIGSRLLDPKGMPAHRVFGNKLLNQVTRLLFGVYVTDSQSGLKAFSNKAIEQIDIRSNGFEFSSEIIWRAKQANLSIAEVPIQAVYSDYSLQKGQSNVNALRIIKNLIKQKLREI